MKHGMNNKKITEQITNRREGPDTDKGPNFLVLGVLITGHSAA